jgi:hypothetical protein
VGILADHFSTGFRSHGGIKGVRQGEALDDFAESRLHEPAANASMSSVADLDPAPLGALASLRRSGTFCRSGPVPEGLWSLDITSQPKSATLGYATLSEQIHTPELFRARTDNVPDGVDRRVAEGQFGGIHLLAEATKLMPIWKGASPWAGASSSRLRFRPLIAIYSCPGGGRSAAAAFDISTFRTTPMLVRKVSS